MSGIAFATAKDGYAYGAGLWSTHDGGAHWREVTVGGTVSSVATGGGFVYATVTTGGKNSRRTRLWRSSNGADRWTRLRAAGDVSEGLTVHGSEVLIQNAYLYNHKADAIGSKLLISDDDGSHFVAHPSPGPGSGCRFSITSASTIWGFCSTGNFGRVVRSTNAGRSFRPATLKTREATLPNGSAFAAATNTTAVVGGSNYIKGKSTLSRTTTGGRTYRYIGPENTAWEYLGFTDSTHGAAIGAAGDDGPISLYYTTDAGRNYRRVNIGLSGL